MGSKIVKKKPSHEGAIKVEKRKREEKKYDENLRGIVRISGYDVLGHVPLGRALTKLQGLGINLSKVASIIIEKELGVEPKALVGSLDEAQLSKIEHIIANLANYGVPKHMLNLRRSYTQNGQVDAHVIGNDLIFRVRMLVEAEKKSYSWKGFRFLHGQKVRGQRTRTTGRKGMTVGVLRKSVLTKGAAATQQGAQAAGAASTAPGPQKTAGTATAAKPAAPKPGAK